MGWQVREIAWQIRREEATRCIPSIKASDERDVARNPWHINQAFTEFYKSLYSSEGEKTHDMRCFLEGLDIPGLSEATQIGLEDNQTRGVGCPSQAQRGQGSWA